MKVQPIPLSPLMQRFILHWGEMGARWGINRTVAQVHALLYLSPEPLSADQITSTLSVARSNVSTSLRELLGWGIVRTVAVLGDRRTHYESLTDVWLMFQIITEERKRRELDPTLEMLRTSVAELEKAGPAEAVTRERLRAMLDFMDTISACYGEMRQISPATLRSFLKIRGKLKKLLGGKEAA